MSNHESNEYFLAANKAVIDAMTSATRAMLAATENLVAINFETAREAFDASADNAQALLSSKNPQEVAAQQSALAKTAVEQAATYSRGVYEVSTKAASELGSLFQSQFEALRKVSQEVAQKAVKASPFGANLAQVAAKQAAQLSESYMTAVSSVLHTAGVKGKK